jgi:hypothetical protein
MISCKYISFLQDFVNFKALRKKGRKNRLKEGSKGADVNEGKFALNIALNTDRCLFETRQHIISVYLY